jgi:DNA primase
MRVDDDTTFLPLVTCPNPNHDTNKRHFQINIRDGLVHCFAGCGISGTFEHAISTIEGITNRQSRKQILKHSRIGSAPIPRKRGKRTANPLPALDLQDFTFLPQAGVEYLEKRGITDASVANWQMRWDMDELRIVIPVFDARSRLRLFVKRGIKAKQIPKYLYKPDGVERNSVLFGLDKIDLGMIRSEGVVLVEGSFDTIRNHQHDLRNTLGLLGSKLSFEQAQLISNLRPKRVITMFDADVSGIEATISVRKRIKRIPIVVCRYPKGKTDPAELSHKEAVRVVSRAVPYVQFENRVRDLIESKEREKVGNQES